MLLVMTATSHGERKNKERLAKSYTVIGALLRVEFG